MNSLMKTLIKIREETVGKEEKKRLLAAEKDLDEFDRLRKHIGRSTKDLRQNLLERNDLLLGSGASEATVRQSHEIRTKLKEIRGDITKLGEILNEEKEGLNKRKEKGKEVTPEQEAQIVAREEIISLCNQHVEEIKRMERAGHNKGNLATGGSKFLTNDPTITELPKIEGELGEELAEKDRIIDSHLEIIQDGVAVLKDMANDLGKEIELQERIIAQIDNDVDKANETLDTLNTRMKKMLTGVQKGDNFIMTFIILCIVLGIAGTIYTQFQ
eukprot:TRINITY_DN1309_c0_g1_i1.p1 TRINITY_DN1309_c0_g1~~TRINITY_DN1309_c0_g1_i1.p1  ORF type:complete len:272 (+),score=120.00 TRINITY_DN1309_c0_g1_i1:89-904(+)